MEIHGFRWMHQGQTNVDSLTISEHKQEFNQPLTMGDVIRVVDVDKESHIRTTYIPI